MTVSGHRARRTCLGCRQPLDQSALLRYVISPEGELLIDYQGKLPGRGAYTCFSVDCIRTALRRGQFRRSLKRDFRPVEDADLVEELRRQIRARLMNLVGMARKAGVAALGSNQVLDLLARKEPLGFVLLAEDVSAGIAAKVEGRARKEQVELYREFDKEMLGQMLGRDEASVVAFRENALADSLKLEFQRYQQITEGL